MKIVDGENKDKSVKFFELSSGDVFIMGRGVYLKTSYVSVEYAVDVKTGIIRTIQCSQVVTPLPNAELHLNKKEN